MGDSMVGIGTSGVDITNLPIVDKVLPMDVGGVFSAAVMGEEIDKEWRDRDEEVAVEDKNDESLSMESDVLLSIIHEPVDPFWILDIWRLDFWEGLELALGIGLVNGEERG